MGDESRQGEKLLAGLGFFGVALMLVAVGTTGSIAVWSLIFCGLANSIMYPTIFALASPNWTADQQSSGVITIGNVGGAVIPPLFGALAVAIGYQHAFILPIICYLYVAYYGCRVQAHAHSQGIGDEARWYLDSADRSNRWPLCTR